MTYTSKDVNVFILYIIADWLAGDYKCYKCFFGKLFLERVVCTSSLSQASASVYYTPLYKFYIKTLYILYKYVNYNNSNDLQQHIKRHVYSVALDRWIVLVDSV